MEMNIMKTQTKTTHMETGSIPKLLAQLAIPAVVAQVINLLYNIVDRIYIGHIPGIGAAALTGVGLFTPILSGRLVFSGNFLRIPYGGTLAWRAGATPDRQICASASTLITYTLRRSCLLCARVMSPASYISWMTPSSMP